MEMIQDIKHILRKKKKKTKKPNNAVIVFKDTQMILCVFSKNN